MLILIGGEKGGTGKTTLATNLAYLRAAAGRDVLLVDTDKQGSASFWTDVRDDVAATPHIECIQRFRNGLTGALRDLSRRYDDLVIDAGGRDSVELRSALVVADRVLVPVQGSQFDVWTMDRMSELIDQARGVNESLDALVIVNRASNNPSVTETRESREFLSDFDGVRLCRTVVRDRIAYRRAAAAGKSVCEMTPRDGKAAAEMQLLYEEVFGHAWIHATAK